MTTAVDSLSPPGAGAPTRSRSGPRSDAPAHSRRVWVQKVEVSAAVLEARLDASGARRQARAATNVDVSDTARAAATAAFAAEQVIDRRARERLELARSAAHGTIPMRYSLASWWYGRRVEEAYQNLHAAEAITANLYDWEELLAEIPEAVARVEASLRSDDCRVKAAHDLRQVSETTSNLAVARADLSKTIETGHNAADQAFSRLRGFRNAVLVAGVVIAILLLAFGVYLSLHHEKLPLCFTPPNAEGVAATWVCPTGEYPWESDTPTVHGPTSPHDLPVIAMLGVLGGAFSAAIAIRGLTASATPYDVPLALAVLKLPLGALTAVAAIIALQGDFVPGLSELDSQGQILAYSLVFGYAQQLLSGLLDRRAQTLLAAAPGKDRVPAPGAASGRPHAVA